MSARLRVSRKVFSEPIENRLGDIDQALQQKADLNETCGSWSVCEQYLLEDAGMHIHIGGRLREGPSLDYCVLFQRHSMVRGSLKPVLRRKRLNGRHAYCLPYDMQGSMLVDVVQRADQRQATPHILEFVVPSYVRLQMLDGCLMATAQSPDAVPTLPWPRRILTNWERTYFGHLVGDMPSEPPNVQLKHEMIQSGPQIEETISNQERPSVVDLLEPADAKDILQPIAVSFNSDGLAEKRTSWTNFSLERELVYFGPPEFR